LERQGQEAVVFNWRQAEDHEKSGMTVWSIFPKDTKYFDPSRSSFMMNFMVDDLDGLLAALREEGVEVDPRREDYDYGRFAWIMDPEGNRIELWEPPKK
jgi:predicted enzyme related to lactoylglutathione lyase